MRLRRRMENDLAGDIREHIEMETRENIERGMSPEDARHAALRKFGNVARITEETHAVWSWMWAERMLQDTRYALRTLRRNPVFATVAILTLALGIGMTTAVFSVVSAVLVKPLPYPDAGRLVWLANYNQRYKFEAASFSLDENWNIRLNINDLHTSTGSTNCRSAQSLCTVVVLPGIGFSQRTSGSGKNRGTLARTHLDILPKDDYASPRMSTRDDTERIELLQGTPDLLILRTLQAGPAHGHAIAKTIERNSEDVLQVEQGSLYPALHRLEQQGWIKAEWRCTETGRMAKFYALTRSGRRQFEKELADWTRLSAAINLVVQEG